MSTFSLRDEFFVDGKEYDSELFGEEGYEPYEVEFIIAWFDGTWSIQKHHLPHPFYHEKCTNDHRVDWYMNVVFPRMKAGRTILKPEFDDIVFVGVYSSE